MSYLTRIPTSENKRKCRGCGRIPWSATEPNCLCKGWRVLLPSTLPMPPCSYVVSFGDIHCYLVETRTTSSQEGIVRWTVILRNLGLFPCASSSTRYELRGGIVWIQLPKER